MTTTVERENLIACLESVSPGLSNREIIEQSTHFVFKPRKLKGKRPACWVYTYNDEISCKSPCPLPETFTGAVRADKFLDCLKKFQEETVGVSESDGHLVFSGKGRKAGFRTEQEILLPLEGVEKPAEWRPLPPDFDKAVDTVRHCAGRDESQFSLVCIHLHPKWVEATDRFQICRWKMKTGFTESILVRQSSLRHVVSLGVTEVSETQAWVHFRNGSGLVLSCRKYVEEYEDLTEYLKGDGVPTSLPKGLVDAAEKASIFSAENPDSDQVLITLKKNRLTIRGQGQSGWYEENKKIEYKDAPMLFQISPALLSELVKKHDRVELSPEKLKVNGGPFVYVTALTPPDDGSGNDTPAEE